MSNCYLCGAANAQKPLNLKKSFTAHSLAKSPKSNKICDRCDWAINLRAYYFNQTKKQYSLLYSRNWSWLYRGDNLIYPTFPFEKDGFPVVENIPTRQLLRNWIIDPPDPPFTIAISESGKKHILFLAEQSYSKEVFPVQFELDRIVINRQEFKTIIEVFEQLLSMGATKTEIVSGNFKSNFLLVNLNSYQEYDDFINVYRGSRLLELVSYVALWN